jgi:hypothetical protein
MNSGFNMNENKTNIALEKFIKLLESQYGLSIEESTIDHLSFIREYYDAKKSQYATSDSRYAKAFLISEVARLMILREIQPKPTGKRKRGKK